MDEATKPAKKTFKWWHGLIILMVIGYISGQSIKTADKPATPVPVKVAITDPKLLAEEQKRIAAEKKAEAKLKKSQGVQIGMSMEDAVASSWGKPRKINRTITANTEREQWVYDGGYLYFTNGILTSMQN